MMSEYLLNRPAILAWVLAAILIAGQSSGATAQSAELITRTDCESAFPLCSIYLVPWQTDDKLTGNMLSIEVDGKPVALREIRQEELGVQVAFVK